MADVILHHYPPSPVSEKIRVAFGLKNLSWKSVEQNRLPDRPELFAMTGGYRRIPVMQIGADIYCDTQCIFRELEQRFPTPSFHPAGNSGLDYGVSRWADAPFFELCVRTAFAPAIASLPPELVADRTRLYFGPDGDMAAEAKDIPHTLSQLRPQLGWLNDQLSNDGPFMHGSEPSLADLSMWYLVWFFKGRYAESESMLAQFPLLLAWSEKMQGIGHGNMQELSIADALATANSAEPTTKEHADPSDPQGIEPGMLISVQPLTNSGESAVEGRVLSVTADRIALARSHELCGNVAVHFPRVGYRCTVVNAES